MKCQWPLNSPQLAPPPGPPLLDPCSPPDGSTPASPEKGQWDGGGRWEMWKTGTCLSEQPDTSCNVQRTNGHTHLQRLRQLHKVPLHSLTVVQLTAQADHLTAQFKTLLLQSRLTERRDIGKMHDLNWNLTNARRRHSWRAPRCVTMNRPCRCSELCYLSAGETTPPAGQRVQCDITVTHSAASETEEESWIQNGL